ncbi:uncharacterized protein LOC111373582 [Olea europaea var. sylvestris]|uniref:uncharacterized protein LOC111373582 n=1 Tax=Olea europaea var. sylvestris TaxID=158386 RepID=UPI000C1CEAFB|nr:uncharacterized protein LOC111373582 [Olea europaea var. sylvestris]
MGMIMKLKNINIESNLNLRKESLKKLWNMREIENEAKQKHHIERPMSSEKEIDEVGHLRSKHTLDGDAELQQKKLLEMGELDCSSRELIADGINVIDTFPGLKNELGEYNCFVNVIIQGIFVTAKKDRYNIRTKLKI